MIKCAGECLDEYFVSTGQLIENTNYINACRTQARIKLDKSVDYFMRNPLGNHHIILMGDHEKVIHEFMQLNLSLIHIYEKAAHFITLVPKLQELGKMKLEKFEF